MRNYRHGAPIWLLLGTLYIAFILEGKFKIAMFICDVVVIISIWIIGYYNSEYITQYSKWGNYFDTSVALTGDQVALTNIRIFNGEEEQETGNLE